MNQNGDEKRIRQLFREMSLDDALRRPAFSRVVSGANSNVGAAGVRVSRKLAFAFAMLCVMVITMTILALRHQAPPVTQISETSDAPIDSPRETPAPSVLPKPTNVAPPRAVVAVRRVRHHKPANDLALAIKLSEWKSPTASLLKSVSEDKLMTLPRLGESLRTLKYYSLDELN